MSGEYELAVAASVVATVVCEMIMENNWTAWHYRRGIVLVRRTASSSADLAEVLNTLVNTDAGRSSRVIAAILGPNEIGFFFAEPGRTDEHIPFLRGHLVLQHNRITATCRLGWGVAAAIVAVAALLVRELARGADPIAVFAGCAFVSTVGGIMAISYLWKAARVLDRILR